MDSLDKATATTMAEAERRFVARVVNGLVGSAEVSTDRLPGNKGCQIWRCSRWSCSGEEDDV